VEKYKKEVSAQAALSLEDRTKFKANLYILLQQVMQYALKKAMTNGKSNSGLHADIVQQYDKLDHNRRQLVDNCFNESNKDRYLRLSKEFETANDIKNAEKQFVNYLVEFPRDCDMWSNYAQFALRHGMQIKAEQFIKKVCLLDETKLNTEMRLILAALYIQRQNWREAKDHLNEVLDEDWQHQFANMLFAFLYKLTGENEMSRKHLAIAKVCFMRGLGSLAPKNNLPKNFRTQAIELKVEIINWATVKTMDQSLSAKENDNLFMSLVNFLLEKTVFNVADIALEYIIDKQSIRYLFSQAKIRVLQKNYVEATKLLN
jgi:tetratricopeptide (TPR) repeat protein